MYLQDLCALPLSSCFSLFLFLFLFDNASVKTSRRSHKKTRTAIPDESDEIHSRGPMPKQVEMHGREKSPSGVPRVERREGHGITEQSGRNEFRPAFKVSGGRHVWSGTEERGFLLVSRGAWASKSRWLNVSETSNWIFVGGLSLGCIFSEQKNPVERSRARRPRLVDYKPFKEISLHWHGPEDFFCGERTSSRGSNACQRCLRRAWLWRQPRTRTLEFETHDAPVRLSALGMLALPQTPAFPTSGRRSSQC